MPQGFIQNPPGRAVPHPQPQQLPVASQVDLLQQLRHLSSAQMLPATAPPLASQLLPNPQLRAPAPFQAGIMPNMLWQEQLRAVQQAGSSLPLPPASVPSRQASLGFAARADLGSSVRLEPPASQDIGSARDSSAQSQDLSRRSSNNSRLSGSQTQSAPAPQIQTAQSPRSSPRHTATPQSPRTSEASRAWSSILQQFPQLAVSAWDMPPHPPPTSSSQE